MQSYDCNNGRNNLFVITIGGDSRFWLPRKHAQVAENMASEALY